MIVYIFPQKKCKQLFCIEECILGAQNTLIIRVAYHCSILGEQADFVVAFKYSVAVPIFRDILILDLNLKQYPDSKTKKRNYTGMEYRLC